MKAAHTRKINLNFKKINILLLNKAKASQKRLKNIRKWRKM